MAGPIVSLVPLSLAASFAVALTVGLFAGFEFNTAGLSLDLTSRFHPHGSVKIGVSTNWSRRVIPNDICFAKRAMAVSPRIENSLPVRRRAKR